MWISQEDENKRWPQNPQQKKTDRPQTSIGINKKFPKSLRLLRRSHFIPVVKGGRRFFGSEIRIDYLKGSKNFFPKLGITVSRRYGKAHQRNRFKRVVREVFRQLHPIMPPHLILHISPKTADFNPTLVGVMTDMKKFLETLLEIG